MFITPAYAQAAGDTAATADSSFIVSLFPIFLIFLVFYFLVIRPQNKRFGEHKDMINNLRRGDKVVTGGGLIGTIKKVNDDELVLELSEGVQVTAVKSTIMTLRSKLEQPPEQKA